MDQRTTWQIEDTEAAVEELEEVLEEMKTLLRRAHAALRGLPQERAAGSYWLAHIRTALDNDHEYLGRSMVTMQDTIDSLRGDVPDEERDRAW